jgi:thioester reductase-like protein/aryl carrier-like protein
LQAIYRKEYDFVRDWNYLQFPDELGARFALVPDTGKDGDGGEVYELVFTKTPETDPYQAVFASYPDHVEFRTKDLFTKHPTIPNLWTHASRSDDVIVFLNGEKVNPVDFESRVSRHPNVAAALMFGEKRFEAGVLVELVDSQKKGDLSVAERARIVKDIWPVIEEANSILPAYARIDEAHIIFTEVEKPVLRTLKGTVRRAATFDLYKGAIEKVYRDVAEMETDDVVPGRLRCEIGSEEEAARVVRQAVQQTMKAGEIEVTEDFFSRGMDSLQVLRLVRYLRGSTALTGVTPSMVYLNPSIGALSAALYQLAQNKQVSEEQKREDQLRTRREILQKYLDAIDALDTKPSSAQQDNIEGKVILLTGSTGTIGSYILSVLLEREDIEHIYCLNRSLDSETLQKERNAQQDPTLPLIFPDSKVTFLTVDLALPSLGLDDTVYEAVRARATHIIHNAWKVDFNLPLQAFELQLAGVVNLIGLCASAPRAPTIVFISSVSAVMNFASASSSLTQDSNQTPVPESINHDISAPTSAGYAESKYIAERLLSHASERLSISARILRLGQIAGAAKSPGTWNSSDWVPALVLGSRALGGIPDSLDGRGDGGVVVDWVPVGAIAEVIVEIGVGQDSQPDSSSDSNPAGRDGKRSQGDAEGGSTISVFHPLNPHRTTWSSLLPSIISALESQRGLGSHHGQSHRKRTIEVVSPAEWLSRLRTAAKQAFSSETDGNQKDGLNPSDSRLNPALRLLDFFSERLGGFNPGPESMTWETENAKQGSRALRGVEGINGGMMTRWVEQWLEGTRK